MVKVVITDDKFSFYAEATFNTLEEAKVFAKCHPLGKEPHTVRFLHVDKEKYFSKEDFTDYKRKMILLATDWLLLPDVKLENKERKIYIEYRQFLRDLDVKHFDNKDIEPFENWLKRNYPEEFLDGGKAQKMIRKFRSYY